MVHCHLLPHQDQGMMSQELIWDAETGVPCECNVHDPPEGSLAPDGRCLAPLPLTPCLGPVSILPPEAVAPVALGALAVAATLVAVAVSWWRRRRRTAVRASGAKSKDGGV